MNSNNAPHEQSLPRWNKLDENSDIITAADILQRLAEGDSLMYHILKQEWEEYIQTLLDAKTPYGSTFLDIAAYWLHNPKCQIGLYVDGPETYRDAVYGWLLNKIVKAYHNIDIDTQNHKESFDISALELSDFNEAATEECKVLSMRVRYAFTLEDLPFQSIKTPAERKEAETQIMRTLDKLSGDVAGQYESLETMTKERRQELIDQHFLSKTEEDEDLVNGNLTSDWPNGRGIYLSNDKEFFVLVNDEDNRVGVLQKGWNIRNTFEKLAKVSDIFNDNLSIARTENLWKLASSPTNIGTGMRLSALVTLPNLARQSKILKEICKALWLSVRGLYGEGSDIGWKGESDISNNSRLGISEAEIVKQVHDGVKLLMKLENDLAKEGDENKKNEMLEKTLEHLVNSFKKKIINESGKSLGDVIGQ